MCSWRPRGFRESRPGAVIEAARDALGVRQLYVDLGFVAMEDAAEPASELEADARTRTGDPFITSEVLYQLSYVGEDD